jgi:hypothetical protein
MDKRMRGTMCALRRIGVLLVCFAAVPVVAAAQDVNVVRSVRAVDSTVEIELETSRDFEIRNDLIVLRIGDKEFSRSKSPKNGSLKRLIFMVPAAEFEQLTDGEQMTVSFRSQNARGDVSATGGRAAGPRWDFGKLNKSMLQR